MLHLLRMYKVINVRFYKHALYNPYLDPFTHVSMECNFFQWQARVGVLSKLPVDILLGNDVSGPTQGAFAVGLSNQQEGALPLADSVTSNSPVTSPTLSEATEATEKNTDYSVPASVMESGNVVKHWCFHALWGQCNIIRYNPYKLKCLFFTSRYQCPLE